MEPHRMPRKHKDSEKKRVEKKLIDYQTKKSAHISLVKSTHTQLRTLLFKKNLSMQEVFNRLASLVCEGDEYLTDILDEICEEKKNKSIRQVTRSDSDSIYDIINEINPFDEDNQDE